VAARQPPGGARRVEAVSLPTTDILDDEASANERVFERVNATQVRYQVMSRINPTGAVVPATMAAATRSALEALSERVGDIDAWLAGRLQWSLRDMGAYLTGEQIDGVALAVEAADNREGLIIADQTGFGKGRICAAVARAAVLSGKNVVFMTEKANLFSDFWRDIRDIGSESVFGRPFLLNDGAKLVDTYSADGQVLVPAWKEKDVKRVLQSGQLPEGSRIMFATYSQFNRKGTKKVEFLESVAGSSHVLLDEAHNFVGDSTTSKTVGAAVANALGTTFSSATYARDVTNLAAYSSVFPWLSRIPALEEMTPAQRRAVAEESVRLATTNGRIIRREHDLTNMVLRMSTADPERLARNVELADSLAPVLSRMAKLARRVDAILYNRNETNKAFVDGLLSADERKAEREVWITANFGSRLSAVLGQFLVALNVEPCIDMCVKSLLEGQKPVVVIEATMEALMREIDRDAEVAGGETEDGDAAQGALDIDLPLLPTDVVADPEAVEPVAARPPTFRDALFLLADRLLKVGVRKGAAFEKIPVAFRKPADVERDVEALENVMLSPEDFERRRLALELEASIADGSLVEAQREIFELVADFPDLSLSPIDDIRDGIEAEGRRLHAAGRVRKPWLADEISARSMRVVGGRYATMPAQNRNSIVARFVNGATHALVLTQAASTGLSIHDSEKFADHAKRHMIELSPPRNVLARIQMWGRVWRRGQLTEPVFSVLDTGLPFHSFDLAVRNRKLRELSASVTGTSRATVALDLPDPIDTVGNDVAHDLLQENQSLAEAMAISLSVEREEADKELYFVNKLFRRLPLLQTERQHVVCSSFAAAYHDRLRSGADVQSGRELDGEWAPSRREILEPGDGTDDPLTGRDVTVTTIAAERDARPLRTEAVAEMVAEGVSRLKGASPFARHIAQIRKMAPDVLQAALPKKIRTVRAALGAMEDNPVKQANTRLENMGAVLAEIAPGLAATLPGEDGEPVDGVVLDVRTPPLERANVAREYEIHFAVPGEERPRVTSLDAVVRNNRMRIISDPGIARALMTAFDRAPGGRVTVERKVIDGNGIGAVLASRKIGFGSRVTYRDAGGSARTAVLVPRSKERQLAGSGCRTNLVEVAIDVLQRGGKVQTDPARPAEGVELRWDVGRGGAHVVIPPSKRAAKQFETPDMLALTGKFEGDWRERSAFVAATRVPQVLGLLRARGHQFHFEARYRGQAVEMTRRLVAAGDQADAPRGPSAG
jgi:hypothetical protein